MLLVDDNRADEGPPLSMSILEEIIEVLVYRVADFRPFEATFVSQLLVRQEARLFRRLQDGPESLVEVQPAPLRRASSESSSR